MNILIIARGYPSKEDPQWGAFEKDQAFALKGLGHNVNIISVDRRFVRKRRKIGITKIEDNGIKVYNLFVIPVLARMIFANMIKKYLIRYLIKYYLKENVRPDVIYSHYLLNNSLGNEIKNKYGIPLVAMEHWSKLNADVLPDYIRRIGRNVYKNADAVLAVSNSLLGRIRQHFGVDGYVVNDLLGQEFLSPKVKSIADTDGRVSFLAMGSLIARKGFDLLIEAFYKAELPKESWKLTIVGGGTLKKKLEEQIQVKELGSNIILVGQKDKLEILDYLQNADVFILSSLKETFSVVCIEAMSQGVPVIATSCGGPEEFVEEKDGLLIKPNDVEALKEAIIKMVSTYRLYDRNLISDDCLKRFSPNVIATKLTNIFTNIVKQ